MFDFKSTFNYLTYTKRVCNVLIALIKLFDLSSKCLFTVQTNLPSTRGKTDVNIFVSPTHRICFSKMLFSNGVSELLEIGRPIAFTRVLSLFKSEVIYFCFALADHCLTRTCCLVWLSLVDESLLLLFFVR